MYMWTPDTDLGTVIEQGQFPILVHYLFPAMIFENRFEEFNIDYTVEAEFIVNWNLDLEKSPSFVIPSALFYPKKLNVHNSILAQANMLFLWNSSQPKWNFDLNFRKF